MNTFIFFLMVLLLIAALDRANRRQSPRAPGLNGSTDRDDRDWARTKLDLLALGAQAEPFTHKPMTAKTSEPTSTPAPRSGTIRLPDPSPQRSSRSATHQRG